MRKVVILCSAYFFINSCVYSAHNYMLKIISSTNHLTPKQFAVLDMLLFVKFLGSFFWTNMADRTNMHRTIIAGGLMGYAIFLSMFRYPIPGMEANGLNFYTIFYYIMFTFFLSAVYATLDAFCLEYLESKKKERKLYGIIKLFGCFGHSFGPICLTLLSKDTKTVRDNTTPIIQSLVFAFIGSAQIMLTFGYLAVKKKAKVEKKEPLNKRIRQNLISIKKLFTVSLGLLLLSVSLQGIHRNIVTTYLELYAEECGISRHSLSCAFAARVIPEASMLFLTGVIDKAIGTYWMIFIGIFFGIFRPLLYSVLNPKTISPTILLFFVYVSEILKGCFSGLFNYSCSKLVKELSTHNTKSLAQGLYNGCYSGLAPCAAGVIAYLLIESPRLKIYDSNVRFLFFSTAILGLVGVIPLVILIMAKIRKEKRMRNDAISINDINGTDDVTVKMVDGNESAA